MEEVLLGATRALRESPQYAAIAEGAAETNGLPVAVAAWICGLRQIDLGRPALAVVPREGDALNWVESADWLGSSASYFPPRGLSPYQPSAPSAAVRARESVALDIWNRRRGVLVCTPRALFRRLPSPRAFEQSIVELTAGDDIPMGDLAEHLVRFGYERVDLVSEIGELALRGGVVDVFGPGMDRPLRLDYFGDTLESLRRFSVDDQRSGASVESARLLPMALYPEGETSLQRLAQTLEALSLPPSWRLATRALREGDAFRGWQNHLVLAFDSLPLGSWLADSWTLTMDRDLLSEEAHGYAAQSKADYERGEEAAEWALPPDLLEVGLEEVESLLASADLEVGGLAPGAEVVDFEGRSTEIFHDHLQRFPHEVAIARERGRQVILVAGSGQEDRLRRWCEDRGVALDGVGVHLVTGDLERGFELPPVGITIYSDRQLFPRRAPRRKSRLAPFLSGLRDLRVGDYLVHRDHGIGQFIALRSMAPEANLTAAQVPPELAGVESSAPTTEIEVMEIAYSGGKSLLMPLTRIDLVERYSGIESVAPRLDRLGGASWSRRQDRVRKSVRKLAIDLLALYAERRLARAPAMPPASDLVAQFEAAFEFEETPDQSAAIETIMHDLGRSQPMDRLLCGDVGFGKTEVAMRAAFRVVEAGYQAALLAPTTILADQHLETFRRRLAGFPVRVEMVSRFRSPAEIKVIRDRMAAGEIDVLIGTHRLLSRDIELPNLGLLIVDEEQRFGVAQKERLRDLKRDVHVLAMSATPVPRTLQLSLAGVRDLSVIESPPRDRMAVETATLPLDDETVREAIEFELERGGQIYFVYNRVEGIEEIARWLRRLVPELRLTIGHGQLPERELAQRMHAFKEHQHDLLLATTIIENGIDISNVNTMLIHRADRFGLSQLYQLRGRVGRGDRLAYCYLLVSSDRMLSTEARQRLSSIREFSELGAGFRVAARDLEIRGAGNLLGAEQSGHIAAVGIETYLRLLEDAVRELRGETVSTAASAVVDLPVPITIPESYIADANLRMEVYRRVAAAPDRSEMLAELRDRFGKPPPSVESLVDVAQLKARAEAHGVQSIAAGRRKLEIRLRQDSDVDLESLVQWIGQRDGVSFSPSGVLSVRHDGDEPIVAFAARTLGEILGE